MVQASQKPVIWTVVIATIVLLLAGLFYVVSQPDEPTAQEIADLVVIPEPVTPVIDVPTAEEIAAEITVPGLRNDNFDDILEGVYPDEVDELMSDCYSELYDEFYDDLEDDLQDLIEDDTGDDIRDLSVEDINYKDDLDFKVMNLGLDEEEDRSAKVTTTMKVKFYDVFGDSDSEYVKVYATGICDDWDKDDNEFDELDVEYVLA